MFRLPSRKRSRSPVDDNAFNVPPTPSLHLTDLDKTSMELINQNDLVSLDVFQELLSNGAITRYFDQMVAYHHTPSFVDRRFVALEIECGISVSLFFPRDAAIVRLACRGTYRKYGTHGHLGLRPS